METLLPLHAGNSWTYSTIMCQNGIILGGLTSTDSVLRSTTLNGVTGYVRWYSLSLDNSFLYYANDGTDLYDIERLSSAPGAARLLLRYPIGLSDSATLLDTTDAVGNRRRVVEHFISAAALVSINGSPIPCFQFQMDWYAQAAGETESLYAIDNSYFEAGVGEVYDSIYSLPDHSASVRRLVSYTLH